MAASGNIQSFNVPTEGSVAIYWKSSTSAALCSLPGQPTANVFKICSPHVTPTIFQMNASFQGQPKPVSDLGTSKTSWSFFGFPAVLDRPLRLFSQSD